MTPKEKAKELYNKFLNPSGDTYLYGMLEHESAKECALIAVDEMIIQNGELYLNGLDKIYYREKNSYLFEVKQEIENL
jgi:hypothetical protein